MGASLVGELIAYAADVPLRENEYRLLTAMALTALDSASDDGRAARRYFDSREAMCLGIGRRVRDYSDTLTEQERVERATALEAVRVAIRGLLQINAVEQIKAGRPGQRAEYVLHLDVERTRETDEYVRRSRARDIKAQSARDSKAQRAKRNRPLDGPGIDPGTVQGSTPGRFRAHPWTVQGTSLDGPGPKEQEDYRNHSGQTTGTTSRKATTSRAPVDKSGADESETAA